MTTSVAVLTTAIPRRFDMLATCLASVAAQTGAHVKHHLVGVDLRGIGPGANLQSLWLGARPLETGWVIPLADDDVLYPDCVPKMIGHAKKTGADIIYARAEVSGRRGGFAEWINRPFDAELLRRGPNYIAATALIRTELVNKLDGWKPHAANGHEDYDFWLRALDSGAQFEYLDPGVPLWQYRFHGENLSQGQLKKLR